jgi:phage terminase small subunit
MNNIERKIVLNYLRHVNYKDGLFVIIQSIKSKLKSQEQYDSMNYYERRTILKKIVVNYLTDEASQSLFGYSAHGTPDKRISRLREAMGVKYDNMSIKEAQIIYKKILDN